MSKGTLMTTWVDSKTMWIAYSHRPSTSPLFMKTFYSEDSVAKSASLSTKGTFISLKSKLMLYSQSPQEQSGGVHFQKWKKKMATRQMANYDDHLQIQSYGPTQQ